MKRYRLLILSGATVLIAVFAAQVLKPLLWNSHHPLPGVLLQIDSLCSADPQRAMHMLDSVAPLLDKNDKYVQAKYNLLKVKARDKADLPLKQNPQMKKVAAFYATHGTDNERMEAFYYLGSTFRDEYDSPNAVKNYLKAIDIAKNSEEGVDTVLLVNVYSQLLLIFEGQSNYEMELYYTKKKTEIQEQAGVTDARDLTDLASVYYLMGKTDSAFFYYEKVLDWLREHDAIRENLDLIAEQVSIYSIKGQRQKAKERFELLERHADSRNLPSNYYAVKARYYTYENKPDSVIRYYHAMLRSKWTVTARQAAYRGLEKAHKAMGNRDSALKYAECYMEAQDSIDRVIKLKQTADAYNEYRYRRDIEEEASVYEHSYTLWRTSLIALLGSLLVILMAAVLFRKGKKLLRGMAEDNRNRLQERDLMLVRSNEQLDRKNRELRKAAEQNARLTRIRLQNESGADMRKIRKKIRTTKKHTQLSDSEWTDLYEAVNHEDKNFLGHIQERVRPLDMKKTRVCYLLRLGLSASEIQVVTGLPRSTAFRLVKEMSEKLGDILVSEP